jgi:hypothetical protein
MAKSECLNQKTNLEIGYKFLWQVIMTILTRLHRPTT